MASTSSYRLQVLLSSHIRITHNIQPNIIPSSRPTNILLSTKPQHPRFTSLLSIQDRALAQLLKPKPRRLVPEHPRHLLGLMSWEKRSSS